MLCLTSRPHHGLCGYQCMGNASAGSSNLQVSGCRMCTCCAGRSEKPGLVWSCAGDYTCWDFVCAWLASALGPKANVIAWKPSFVSRPVRPFHHVCFHALSSNSRSCMPLCNFTIQHMVDARIRHDITHMKGIYAGTDTLREYKTLADDEEAAMSAAKV